ncbi:hypothetical protein ACU4HD_36840 [Cupriavidus basilensis]
MQIARADFDAMLAQGFASGEHLDAGYRYYGDIFGSMPASTAGSREARRPQAARPSLPIPRCATRGTRKCAGRCLQ